MKNKNSIIVVAVLLTGSVVNYMQFISDGSVKAVEFVSIFAIGALAGILLTQVFGRFKGEVK